MSLLELRKKIERKEAHIAVIGLGYVGLPVACKFAQAGFSVLGVEIKADHVELINAGISPFEGKEPGLAELLAKVVTSGRFRATVDYEEISDQDVVLIDVETPVDENNIPQYKALRSAISCLGPILRNDALVIVESTVSPGTMSNMVLPLLEESTGKSLNQGFYLGNCPERVMPGKLLSNLQKVSRVVGGMTPEIADTMVALYRHVVQAELDPTDCLTAELVKTVENAYRDVQIAFANEVALVCEAIGGDVWKVRELVNKTPYRQMHLPGSGVGGHCIPKDPWLLAFSVEKKDLKLRIIPSARMVNDLMPLHMVEILIAALEEEGKSVQDARILVMGYSYLENSDDVRNSPSSELVRLLDELGSRVIIHDPYVPAFASDLLKMANGCDAIVVMVRHQDYYSLSLNELKNVLRTPILVDGRGMFKQNEVERAQIRYWGVGISNKHNSA
jgi:UDP-N-acetyl-D-mannosaminuronic acid dehydrogenase